jgi:hypothetical protein
LQAKARKVMICRETETIAEADWATARDGHAAACAWGEQGRDNGPYFASFEGAGG